jgi:hypothetical protein
MEINQLISREVARRQRIGRNGAIKRKALKEVPIEERCNKCGTPKDEFSLTTFYSKNNKPEYRVCDDCYKNSGDVRSRYFYGDRY